MGNRWCDGASCSKRAFTRGGALSLATLALLEALQSACHAAGIDTAEAAALMERTRRQAS